MSEIFKMSISDAWGGKVMYLQVSDDIENNVYAIDYEGIGQKKEPKEKLYNLDIKVIEEIKDVLRENSDIFEIDYIEFPPMLDGWTYNFEFNVDDKHKEINANNIFYYKENDEGPNAKKILKVFDQIGNILVHHKVDDKFTDI